MPLFVLGEGRFVLLGIAGVLVLWALAGATTGVWGRWSPTTASVAALLALIPLTMWVTPSQGLTQEHLGYFLAQLIALYTVSTWANTQRRVQIMVYALVGVGCALALSAPFIMQPSDPLNTGSTLPETIQKNVLGGTLAVLLPLCVALVMARLGTGHYKAALIASVATGVILLAIIFSQSRGAYLAVVVSLLAIAAVRVRPLRFAVPGGLLAISVGVWLLNLGPSLARWLQSDSVGDFSVRVEIWSRALQVIHDFPLTGIGLGAFRTAVPALYPYVISDPEKVHHAHNLYLQIGAELGLPALAAFIALIISIFINGSQRHRLCANLKNSELSWLNLGCIGALVAMLSHGLLDAVTWGTKPAFLAWAVLGLLNLHSVQEQE